MLQVKVGNTLNRTTVLVPETTKLSDVISMAKDARIEFDQEETFTLNGVPMKRSRGDLDRTFADYGVSGSVSLTSVKNSQNA